MRYSLKEEDISKLYSLQEQVSEHLQECFQQFVDEMTSWGKKFNSQLILKISQRTVSMISEYALDACRQVVKQFDDTGYSLVNISRRFFTGEEAINEARKVQEQLTDSMTAYTIGEITYSCTGQAALRPEWIDEYQELVSNLLTMLETYYQEDLSKSLALRDENILADSVSYLVEIQYGLFINIAKQYDQIFQAFLEWYQRTSQKHQTVIEELEKRASQMTSEVETQTVDQVLADILDKKLSAYGNNSGASGNYSENSKGAAEQSLNQEAAKQVDALEKELSSPEEIKACKDYVSSCDTQIKACLAEKDPATKRIPNGKLVGLREFLKKNGKKYGKPAAKILSLLVQTLAPGTFAAKLAGILPDITDALLGAIDTEEDVKKANTAVELLNAAGVQSLPEDPEQMKQYFQNNAEEIRNKVIDLMMKNEDHLSGLGIGDAVLNGPELKQLYEERTGKSVDRIPQKEKAFGYDFNSSDPELLKENGSMVYVSPKGLPEQSLNQQTAKQIDDLGKELDSPEKISGCKDYVSNCDAQIKACLAGKDPYKKRIPNGKLLGLREFLKTNGKKYGKPTAKALAIAAKALFPEGTLAAKIAEALPDITEALLGAIDTEEDVKKANTAVELLNAVGVQSLPEDTEQMKQYLQNHADELRNKVIDLIMKNEDHLSSLGINDVALNEPELRQLYEERTGKSVERIPQKYSAFAYDFNDYNPELLNKVQPRVEKKTVDSITNAISQNRQLISTGAAPHLGQAVQDLWPQLKNPQGYVRLDTNSALNPLISELNRLSSEYTSAPILENIEGKYNKEDIQHLLDALAEGMRDASECHAVQKTVERIQKGRQSPLSDDEVDQIRTLVAEVQPEESMSGVKQSGFEEIRSYIDQQQADEQGMIILPETTGLGKLVQGANTIHSRHSGKPMIAYTDGKCKKSDVKQLLTELSGDTEQIAQQGIQRGAMNFVRREMGYAGLKGERDIPYVKNLHELIAVVNAQEPYFQCTNSIQHMINNAQNIQTEKGGEIRKKHINLTLIENIGTMIGQVSVSAFLLMCGFEGIVLGVVGMLFFMNSFSSFIGNDADRAYAHLLLKLGEERTEYLMSHYKNVRDTYFELMK